MKINPNESATGFAGNVYNKGISIRAQIAAMAMQGLLANVGYQITYEYAANTAINFADELINKLNETS